METVSKQLAHFWQITVEVWNQGVLGIDVSRLLIALLILVTALIVRRLFARIASHRLLALTRRTSSKIDDAIVTALEPPLRFVPVVLGVFFAAEYLGLPTDLDGLADNVVRSLIAFTLFWSLYRVVDPLAFVFNRLKDVLGGPMVEWLIKAIKLAFVLLGSAAILEIWGINVAALIAGLGLFGVAVALGAQDLFKNLIAGILILAEKRFENGDWIRVDGVIEGTVEKIGFRSTFVRRFDKAPVYVPNTQLADNAVINFSKMTNRRIYWMVGVEYRTTVDQLKAIRDGIESYIIGNPEFIQPDQGTMLVRVDSFGDSSIDIMIYCFTHTTGWSDWLEIKERFAYHVKDVVEGAGSGFAFPSRSLYIETMPGAPRPEGEPEAFEPPVKSDQQTTP
ncbi:MAG: mechanosensitive ion channel family protein [Alphaproteobacteria bacterium]|nr:mechanosensitive ion channel family protein [Alphaproteobacteria bacterium]